MMFTEGVIKLDLRLSNKELKSVYEKMGILEESINENRKSFDVIFFMAIDSLLKFEIFAFIRKGQRGIEFTKDYYRALAKMNNSTPEDVDSKSDVYGSDDKWEIVEENGKFVEKRIEPTFNYDVDSILEKISQKGIEYLTKAEKDFLDNQSK